MDYLSIKSTFPVCHFDNQQYEAEKHQKGDYEELGDLIRGPVFCVVFLTFHLYIHSSGD